MTRAGVVTADAAGGETEHEVDTVVYGTGFTVTEQPIAERVVGRDGRTLAEHWAGTGMQSLHGTTTAGFPGFFLLVGPNTGLGHTSVVYVIETQVAYVLQALDAMDAHGVTALEPRQEVQDRWNADLQRQLAHTVWDRGGCSSWYQDAEGRNTTLWPTFTFTFRRRLARFPLEAYAAEPRRERVGAA